MGFQGEQGLPGIAGKNGVPVSVSLGDCRLYGKPHGGNMTKLASSKCCGCLEEALEELTQLCVCMCVFQGALTSEQHIRELCGSMIDGEHLTLTSTPLTILRFS